MRMSDQSPDDQTGVKGINPKEKESEVQDPRLMNQTTKKARPFEQLPKHIQCLIVAQSGLSEPEFHRRRQARRREELLGEKIRSCKKEVA